MNDIVFNNCIKVIDDMVDEIKVRS